MSKTLRDWKNIFLIFLTALPVAVVRAVPNLTRCDHTEDLKDSNSNFIKSICYMPSADGNQASVADDICRSLNMNLFTIESAETYKAYTTYLLNRFAKGTVVKVMINARKTQNGRGLVTVSQPEVQIFSNYTVNGNNGCVGITKTARNFVNALASGCSNNKGNFHCEYGAPTPWLVATTEKTTTKIITTKSSTTKVVTATTTEKTTTKVITTKMGTIATTKDSQNGNKTTTTKKTTTKKPTTKSDPNAILPVFSGSAGNQSCGTFIPYDYLKDPLGPTKKGVKIGTADMPQTYIGIGNDQNCNGMTNVPGHILVPPNNPVCMIVCNKVQIDADTPQYLLNHPKLAWIDQDKVPSSVKLVESVDTAKSQIFNFGRILTKTRSGTEYKIGTINGEFFHYNTGSHKQLSLNTVVYESSNYQVLICKP